MRRAIQGAILALALFCWLLLAGCGGGSSGGFAGNSSVSNNGVTEHAGHIVMVLEENHSYSEVIGNPQMPYLNSLASQNALATNYFANTHPSIGNYFELTAGQIISNDDGFTGTVTADDIVRELVAAGKSWKSYAESLPAPGYLGGDVYPYARHHNPFTYFQDVISSAAQQANIVPFTQFQNDLNARQLPNFSFIIPNLLHDANVGTLPQADQWLQSNIAPLVSSPLFQQDGLLIIVFDESNISDTAFGGGHVAWIAAGPMIKKAYQSTTFYQHQSTLRMVLKSLGIASFPGDAADAPDMGEFFQ